METRIQSHPHLRSPQLPSFATETDARSTANTHRPRTTIVPNADSTAHASSREGHGSRGTRGLEGLLDSTDEPFADASNAEEDHPVDDRAEDDEGPPTQPRIPTIAPLAPSDDGSTSFGHHEPVFATRHAKDKWYLRLQLRTDCLAELWVRDQTPHNVLAWSDGMESWVPLLTVPELRDAIRSAQDKKTRDLLSQAPPAKASVPPPSEGRIPLPPPRCAGSVVYAAPARAAKFWAMPHPRPVSSLPPPVPSTMPVSTPPRASTIPPMSGRQSVPPVAPARTSTIPPSMELELPTIPRPAKIPEFVELAKTSSAEPSAITSTKAVTTVPMPPPQPSTAASHGTLSPPALTLVPPARSERSATLVNLERVLWMCAGVSVATAGFFVFGAKDAAPLEPVSGVSASGSPAANQTVKASVPRLPTSQAPGDGARGVSPPKGDTASVEDLPLVGKSGSAREARRDARPVTAAPRMTPAVSVTHASTEKPSASPPSQSTPAVAEDAFSPTQARRVLSSAAARAQSCAEGPVSGNVQVTFAPSGFVQGASLTSVEGENVRSGCVLRAFQEARVSPFSGAPVSVKKSF